MLKAWQALPRLPAKGGARDPASLPRPIGVGQVEDCFGERFGGFLGEVVYGGRDVAVGASGRGPASDDASFVIGQILSVNGGELFGRRTRASRRAPPASALPIALIAERVDQRFLHIAHRLEHGRVLHS